jgi:hypothetical protein
MVERIPEGERITPGVVPLAERGVDLLDRREREPALPRHLSLHEHQ